MKKIVLFVAALLVFHATFGSPKFEPRDTWPYLYENFQNGVVRANNGALISDGAYNVCIHDGSLHYISDGKIMQANMSSVYTAKVGEDIFVNIFGKLYRIIAESGNGAIVEGIEIDIDELNKVEVGYGVSVASGSQLNLNTLVVDAGSANILKDTFGNIENNKFTGKILPLKETTYLYTHAKLIRANKKDISDLPGLDKSEVAGFIKKEKIKWKKTDSLLKVLEFVDKQLSE